ncbi:MAG: hypothetical protein M3N18_07330, partial [Actinomycetota bacterium]|nr:hypothetical protein [Actinomycetota bacterium]
MRQKRAVMASSVRSRPGYGVAGHPAPLWSGTAVGWPPFYTAKPRNTHLILWYTYRKRSQEVARHVLQS